MTTIRRPGAAGPAGYRLVLPRGWTQLDVRQDPDVTVAEVLAEVPLDDLPIDERPKRRAAIEGRLRSAISRARKVDTYAMYLAVQGMHGMAIPASFVVAEATDFSGSGPAEDVLDELLAAPNAVPVLVDGSDAVRTLSIASALDEASGQEVPAQQVVYTIPVPGSPQWLLVVFEVIAGDGMDDDYAALVNALIGLFDAVMTTFRWREDGQS